MSVLTKYLQLPSGFWTRKSDNSGPYFVDVETDLKTGELWGNFPQTYSHVGLINCAMRLSRDWEEAF